MNYIDIYVNDNDVNTIMAPVDIPKSDILTIGPLFTGKGKLYKNVSYIKDKHGNGYKVVGNYRKIIEAVHGRNDIGFNVK